MQILNLKVQKLEQLLRYPFHSVPFSVSSCATVYSSLPCLSLVLCASWARRLKSAKIASLSAQVEELQSGFSYADELDYSHA